MLRKKAKRGNIHYGEDLEEIVFGKIFVGMVFVKLLKELATAHVNIYCSGKK